MRWWATFACAPSRLRPALSEGGDGVDFDLRPSGQRGNLNRGARGRRNSEVAAIDFIDSAEFAQICDEQRAPNDVGKIQARCPEHSLQILHHSLGLRGGVAFREITGLRIERDLPREKEHPRALCLNSL